MQARVKKTHVWKELTFLYLFLCLFVVIFVCFVFVFFVVVFFVGGLQFFSVCVCGGGGVVEGFFGGFLRILTINVVTTIR